MFSKRLKGHHVEKLQAFSQTLERSLQLMLNSKTDYCDGAYVFFYISLKVKLCHKCKQGLNTQFITTGSEVSKRICCWKTISINTKNLDAFVTSSARLKSAMLYCSLLCSRKLLRRVFCLNQAYSVHFPTSGDLKHTLYYSICWQYSFLVLSEKENPYRGWHKT